MKMDAQNLNGYQEHQLTMVSTEGLHIIGNNDEYEYNTKDEGNIVIDETDNVYDSKEDEDYDPKNDNKSAQSSRTEEEFDDTVSDTTNDL